MSRSRKTRLVTLAGGVGGEGGGGAGSGDTGALTQTMGAFTISATGTETDGGQLSQTMGAFTISATGTVVSPAYDPAVEALTGWWRDWAQASAGPPPRGVLGPVASAGPSDTPPGSRALSAAPSGFIECQQGASLNGHASARFSTADGTGLSPLRHWSDFAGATGAAWTASALLVVSLVKDTLGAPGTDTPNNDAICADTNPGFIGGALVSADAGGLTSAGVNAYCFSGGFQNSGVTAFVALHTPMKVQFGYDGAHLWARVNGAARVQAVSGIVNPAGLALDFLLGCAGTDTSRNLNADMYDFLIVDAARTDADCDKYNDYYLGRYGV